MRSQDQFDLVLGEVIGGVCGVGVVDPMGPLIMYPGTVPIIWAKTISLC